jgi:hypothetical protein
VGFSYQIVASNSPTSYSVTGTLPAGLTLNTVTGVVSGTPTVATVASLTLKATNSAGTGTLPFTLTISAAAATLSSAIDYAGAAVTSTGNTVWNAQNSVTFDGVDAAVSGVIGNSQSSSLKTSVTGPTTLDFRWKVDSEANYDKLSYLLDGVVKESISGTTAWALRSVTIPSGVHQVEWQYAKDSSVASGADAGWVDTVSVRTDAIRLSGDLAFGKVNVSTSSASRNLTIFNDSASSFTVTSITYPTGFSGAFSGTVAAGSSQVVPVTFSPTLAQIYSSSLTVNSNAPSGVNTLAVSGEGQAVTPTTPTLSHNVPVTNLSGAQGSSLVYKIVVPTGATSLTVTTSSGSGDMDLYLKRGATPTTSIFDLKSDGSTTAESVVVNTPIAGDWYVLMSGFSAYSGVTIKAAFHTA